MKSSLPRFFRKQFTFVFAVLFCTAGTKAHASRTLRIAPLRTISAAGGTLNDSAGARQVCLQTGLSVVGTDALRPEVGLNGVCAVWQKLYISLSNLGSVTQTISYILESGTQVTSTNSSGTAAQFAMTTGPSLTLSQDLVIENFTLKAGESTNITLFVTCSADDCSISSRSSDKAILKVVAGGPTWNKTCPPAAFQLCAAQESTFLSKIVIAEDRGAVSGLVSANAAAAGGRNFVISTSPNNLPLNGGRAF